MTRRTASAVFVEAGKQLRHIDRFEGGTVVQLGRALSGGDRVRMQRTVPRKVSEFLMQRQGRTYCDICIQERLGLKWRQQVQLITATLACTEVFARELGPCSVCNETKQVISSLKSSVGPGNPGKLVEFSGPLGIASRAERKI